MNRVHLRDLSALLAGGLFGAGLAISGMTRPQKVLGFLDVFGDWDASLMFVMIGAIAVHVLAYRAIRGRSTPMFAPKFVVPSRRDLDAKLLIGAAVFGAGWGLAGYCPGPGLASLAGGGAGAAVFVIAMLGGMFSIGKLESFLSATTRATPAPSVHPTHATGLKPSAATTNEDSRRSRERTTAPHGG